MSMVRPLRRPSRVSSRSDWRQTLLTCAIVAFPVLLCLFIAHSSGTPLTSFTALLPKIRLPQQLPSLSTVWHSPSTLLQALPVWEGEANPSPLLSPAAEVMLGHVCSALPAEFAVLGTYGAFSRAINGSLRDTKVGPDGTLLQSSPLGDQLDNCLFEVHDEAFERLIGPRPVVKRLAQEDHQFAHEVGPSLCSCAVTHGTQTSKQSASS